MDLTLHQYRDRILETLRTRLSKIPTVALSLRFPRWGYLLPVAVLLGFWAHRSSSEEGRMGWLKENPPSEEVWNAVLTRKGFSGVEDPAWKEKAYAEMPEASRRRDSGLISEDRHTIAIRMGTEWRFFQLGGTKSGKATGAVVVRELWEGLGIGWEAIARFDRTELPLVRLREDSPLRIRSRVDPRSLEY